MAPELFFTCFIQTQRSQYISTKNELPNSPTQATIQISEHSPQVLGYLTKVDKVLTDWEYTFLYKDYHCVPYNLI